MKKCISKFSTLENSNVFGENFIFDTLAFQIFLMMTPIWQFSTHEQSNICDGKFNLHFFNTFVERINFYLLGVQAFEFFDKI